MKLVENARLIVTNMIILGYKLTRGDKMEAVKIKTFPLRMDEAFHGEIEEALKNSTIKSKHEYILKAIAEKVEREKAV